MLACVATYAESTALMAMVSPSSWDAQIAFTFELRFSSRCTWCSIYLRGVTRHNCLQPQSPTLGIFDLFEKSTLRGQTPS